LDTINTINKIRKVAVACSATVLSVGLVLLAAALLLTSSGVALAQDAEPPVAPALTPATPPAAQPVDQANTAPTSGPPGTGLIVTTPAAARFDSAMVFFNAGQYADAVTAFSDFITTFPQDRRREEALYRLAESYRNLKRTDDALAAYTFQVQNYPEGPLRINGELRRGAILFDAGKYADALAPLQVVADKGDGELQQAAKYLLGRALLSAQKEADGRAVLQSLVDEQPTGKLSGRCRADAGRA